MKSALSPELFNSPDVVFGFVEPMLNTNIRHANTQKDSDMKLFWRKNGLAQGWLELEKVN